MPLTGIDQNFVFLEAAATVRDLIFIYFLILIFLK